MDRKKSGFLAFAIIIFIMYAFGIHTFEAIWSFPSQRSVPLMVLALVGTGIYATIRLGFPQIKHLKHGINVTRGIYDDPNDEGDLNHFKALTTALSATVGIGNIAGVATAIYYGGPGALFWMWVTAFFGTTLKYAECTLSLKYREMDALGKTAGGPMYTIENGLGKNWRWLAVSFASFAIICSFATGNAIQSFTVSDQIYSEIKTMINEPFEDTNQNGIYENETFDDLNQNGIYENETFEDTNNNGVYDQEPFEDTNGNGFFDNEKYVDVNNNGLYDQEPFDDINQNGIYENEPFDDLNQNGIYENETFEDTNNNGIRDTYKTHSLTKKHKIWDGFSVSIMQFINGIIMAVIVGMVIIGGINRIGSVTGFLAPFMALIYVISASIIIISNFDKIADSFGMIISMAFNPPATIAGTGGGILMTMLWGIKRGLYSNEAGQGSAAIAHSTAKTKHPVREGAVAMLGPYIDTLVICTMTGLVIISTGSWMHTEFFVKISASSAVEAKIALETGIFQGRELLNSSLLTSFAFKEGLSFIFNYGDKIVTLSVLLFAISTAIAWSFYGNRAVVYLFGEKAITPYLWVYVLFVFIGGIAELEAIWAFGDAALGIMTFPNLISIVLLTGALRKMSKEYFSVKHAPYR